MHKKHFTRILSMLLALVTLFGTLAVPASAASSLSGSGTVTIQQAGQEYGFAFAPKGAARGQKYCIFRQRADESGQPHVSCVVQWSDNLKDIAPQDWGFDMKKIKAVTQKPRKQTGHRR